nr:hypothetical protein [Burkholderia glumae]
MRQTDVQLKDGRYRATCRERSFLKAATNGHSQVFPRAIVVVKKGRAYFYVNDVEVWSCNATYAAAHFEIEPA